MHNDLQRLDIEMTTELAGLSALRTQATLAARPDKWSIQQITEHLLLSYQASIPAIRKRLEKGSPTRGTPSLRQHLAQFMLISLGRFPNGRQAPATVVPSSLLPIADGADLGLRVHAALVELDKATTEGERVFGDVRAASHLLLGPLSMQQWRRFHLVHGRHHLKQIRAIRSQSTFGSD